MIAFNKSQKRALSWMADRQGSAIFMPPGFGKTRAWLEHISRSAGHVLVVAPKVVCMDTWPRESVKWGYDFEMRFLHGTKKTLDRLPHVSLINYEGLPWLAGALEAHDHKRFPFELVVFDELSKMKDVTTQRWKAMAPWLERFPQSTGGTGTPVGNHLKDLYGEVSAVDLGASLGVSRNPDAAKAYKEGYERFLRRWFEEDEYTHAITPTWDAEEEIMDAIADVAISFDINDLDMPPLKFVRHDLHLPADVRKQYEELQKSNLVQDLDVYAMNAAVKSGKKRQFASGAVYNMKRELVQLHNVKADHLRTLVGELQGSPLMIFFEYVHDYAKICEVLGPVPAIYGGTPAREVPRLVKQWNDGKLPALALHPRSAAYGLNMQDSGHHIVFWTLPWSLELVKQGIGRLWRQGQRNKVFVHSLVVVDTEDERVWDRVQEKDGTHQRIMDGLL